MEASEDGRASAEVLFEVPELPGTPIGRYLMLVDNAGKRAVYYGPTPIHIFDAGDEAAEKACVAMLSRTDLASDVDIAGAFGRHRNTVGRLATRLVNEGLGAVVPAKRGPKGPHKVTPEVLAVVAADGARLAPAELARIVAERTGVALSVSHVRRLVAAHRSAQPELAEWEPPTIEQTGDAAADGDGGDGGNAEIGDAGEPVSCRNETGGAEIDGLGGAVDGGDAAGAEASVADDSDPVAGEDGSERSCFEPPVVVPGDVHGPYMGLTLYYPAIAELGLVDEARAVFGLPRSERFGVRAVTLSVLLLTLLGKPTLEAAKHLRRAAFGAVVGSGRAPAVKTLRRKLAELASQKRAAEFGSRLARRWVERGMVATAYLYVDGHMKAYTGKRHLEKVWNSQRRMPLPGIHSYFVGDGDGRPLLFINEPLSTNLAKAMPRIIEAIREVVGDRKFTVIFDRGGYDGKLFAWLDANHISFITYQRGNPKRPADVFARRETRFEGRRVRFMIAEDRTKVGGTGPWRRIVVRTKNGHQTPIVTNLGTEVGAARIACLMFARWRQENLFKYMGEHHGLDSLISYGADPADPDVMIPNPDRKQADRQIAEHRKQLAALKAELGDALLDEPRDGARSAHGLKIAQGGAVRRLRTIEDEVARLVAVRKAMPTHVSVAASGRERDVMRLEHKSIIDRIKISAYNIEEWLLDRLIRHYPNPHDARDLLRSFAELSGRICTTDAGVVVTLDPPDTPIHRRALHGLIDELNATGVTFPDTDVPVTYRVGVHQSDTAA